MRARLIFLSMMVVHGLACNTGDESPSMMPFNSGTDGTVAISDAIAPIPGNRQDVNPPVIDATLDALVTPVDAAPTVDIGAECTDRCMPYEVIWGRTGGLTSYDMRYALSPCREQRVFVEAPFAANPDDLTCTRIIPGCADPLGAQYERAVDAMMQLADAALCETSTLFGIDSRPVDGQILSIAFDNKECLLGDPCDGVSAGCIDPPDVLLATADALWDLGRDMERDEPSCAMLTNGL